VEGENTPPSTIAWCCVLAVAAATAATALAAATLAATTLVASTLVAASLIAAFATALAAGSAAFPPGFGRALGVILEVAGAGRAALAGDFALLFLVHGGESALGRASTLIGRTFFSVCHCLLLLAWGSVRNGIWELKFPAISITWIKSEGNRITCITAGRNDRATARTSKSKLGPIKQIRCNKLGASAEMV
jgi:hypothetical protein